MIRIAPPTGWGRTDPPDAIGSVEVTDVVIEAVGVGSGYATWPGHPVSGVKDFIMHRHGGTVCFRGR